MPPVALTIAGSDPSGGAGIQADLKTFHQYHVYGTAVLTLITVQNTSRVSRVETLAPDLVAQQIAAVTEDLPVRAAKTGALGNAQVISAVATLAREFRFPLIVDPVMISKHGETLLEADARRTLLDELLPLASLVTPNVPEAEALTSRKVTDRNSMESIARDLLRTGCRAVLIKGGHLRGSPDDLFLSTSGSEWLQGERIDTRHTHGTGCTYSAAITALVAHDYPLLEAVRAAKVFMQEAIATAPGLGSDHGPVNHWAKPSRSRTLPANSESAAS